MTKVQPITIPTTPPCPKRMYRGVVTTQAVVDVFVRATSDVQANKMIKGGKGQRKKPRFGEWELSQQAIAVDAYSASAILTSYSFGLTEQEVGKVYAQVLHNTSVLCRGVYTDSERQAMVDAVRGFYDLLTKAIRAKTSRTTG
jgi:hypothetical protein